MKAKKGPESDEEKISVKCESEASTIDVKNPKKTTKKLHKGTKPKIIFNIVGRKIFS